MDYIAFGQRIRRFRKEKHLTQEELAERAELSASFLGHIERGSRVASIETLMNLCRVLEVTPNELLGDMLPEISSQLPERITISPAVLLEGMVQLLQKQETP